MAAALHYVTSGPTDAPALLLIHPLGSSNEFWDECAAIWSERFHVVACDLRGAGRSPISDRPWKVDEHVRDIVSVREALQLRDVIPIGCAMGSMIATAYAGADTARVRGLILSNTTTRLGEKSRQRHESRLKLVAENGIEALLPMVVNMAFDGLPKDQRYMRYMERFRQNDPRGYRAMALGMIGTDNTQILSSLICPSLVIAGAHDILLPPELSRKVHALLKGSEFAVIETAAHFAPYQAPDVFAALVVEFIDSNLPVSN